MPAYRAKQDEAGGPNSEAWAQYASDLNSAHAESSHVALTKAFAAGTLSQAKAMSMAARDFQTQAEWLLKESGVHVLYAIIGDNYLSSTAHAHNIIASPSPQLMEFWRSTGIKANTLYLHLLKNVRPEEFSRTAVELEQERKKGQKRTAHTMYQAFADRLRFLLTRLKVLDKAPDRLGATKVPWGSIPSMLDTHQLRLINCYPADLAPLIGAFKPGELPQRFARVIWEHFGPWVDPSHEGPVDSSGDPIIDIVPWTAEEQNLLKSATSAEARAAARAKIPLMLDRTGATVARVCDIERLSSEYKAFTSARSQQYKGMSHNSSNCSRFNDT